MDSFKLLINGRLEDGDATMNVVNPATEEVLAVAPRASKAQLDKAVAAAKAAFPAWSATPLVERKKGAFKQPAPSSIAHAHELARLLTQEQGKPPGRRHRRGFCVGSDVPLLHQFRFSRKSDRG